MENRIYNLALSFFSNIGNVRYFSIIDKYKSAKDFFQLNYNDLEEFQNIIDPNSWMRRDEFLDKANYYLEFANKKGWGITFFDEKEYPKRLLSIYDPPIYLFYVGDISIVNKKRSISIVGSRKVTSYGKSVLKHLFDDIAGEDILIVSGLAYGVDALAHKGAIDNSLKTVGVVGTSLDIEYPSNNRNLYSIMKKEHLILSEFLPTTKPEKHNFPIRNRVVSGLCDVLIVVESAKKGGSLITAQLAIDQGREVFAVPGNIFSDQSGGTNRLIRDGANMLLDGYNDVAEIMGWRKKSKFGEENSKIVIENELDKFILDILNDYDNVHIDEIIRRSNFSLNDLMVHLSMLELKGYISKIPGNYYERIK